MGPCIICITEGGERERGGGVEGGDGNARAHFPANVCFMIFPNDFHARKKEGYS
jgi:hypothetical protein